MTQNPTHFWPWLAQMFGATGAVLVLLVAAILIICIILTLVYVWRLNSRMSHIEQALADLNANQNRQQQVERLKRDRDRDRKKSRRRR